jgi:hypothetical protein
VTPELRRVRKAVEEQHGRALALVEHGQIDSVPANPVPRHADVNARLGSGRLVVRQRDASRRADERVDLPCGELSGPVPGIVAEAPPFSSGDA